MKLKPNTPGVWCREDKKFYYLNSGHHSIRDPQRRIISALVTRGLIEYDPKGVQMGHEPYKLMTFSEAEEAKYEIEVIYLNKMVQQMAEKKETDTLSGWT